MKLFADTSIVLAACIGSAGASRFIIEKSGRLGWQVQISPYVVLEVEQNLSQFSGAEPVWRQLRSLLRMVPDVVSFPWPTVMLPAKDRPIRYAASAWSDVLLTLDRHDFGKLIGGEFYGFPILTPRELLVRERRAGRLLHWD